MTDQIDFVEITQALKNKLESLVAEKHNLAIRQREIDHLIGALHESLSGLLLYADALAQTDEKLTGLVKAVADLLLPSNVAGTLTEACRAALRKSKRRLSAIDVKKAVEAAGFDFSNYSSNPLSSIHTTLRRLKETEKPDIKETVIDGIKYYRWIGEPEARVEPVTSLADLLPSLSALSPYAASLAASLGGEPPKTTVFSDETLKFMENMTNAATNVPKVPWLKK